MTTLSNKLQALNAKKEYNGYTIAHYTNERGDQVSPSYWWGLMNGKKLNPSRKRVMALADLFQVPCRYLSDDEVSTPVEAVIAETQTLSSDELKQVIDQLQQRLKREADGKGSQTK